jgi:non-ribosomal peptide synthetase component F
LYSIYNIFLSVFSGQKTVISSIVNAGREHPSLQGIVGFFVNSVLFKTEIDYDEVFIDFARQVQDRALEFFTHQNYPLELVLDEVGQKYPEVPVSFNMFNNYTITRSAPLENPGSFNILEMQNVKFDFELYVMEYRNGIEANAAYNKNLFKADNIRQMMDKYCRSIELIAMDPYKKIRDYKEEKKGRSFKKLKH